MVTPNGTAPEAAITVFEKDLPTVVGINFGNTYASIAVLTKEGLAECIANEDGERQIACAVSFHGEEMYIGNQAKPQLVKNAQNTITNFRNLLGKKFSEIPKDKPVTSAPVTQHPEQPEVAAYKVSVLQPAPTPIPIPRSTSATPAVSNVATPRSEPIPIERILTVAEVNTMFLKSLVQSAQDFLGKPIDGAVISVPSWFDENARGALEAAANDAGIKVLQLLDEAAAASVVSIDTPTEGLQPDRTSLVVDVGQSSVSLSLLAIRHGLIASLASAHEPTVGGEQVDEKLVKFFAKEFTKKTKVPLTVCPARDGADKRAEAKLRIAVEHTKRTVSASPGAATCSVESLKDGVDFTGSINRMRFDLEVRAIYAQIVAAAQDLLATAGLEALHVDEVIYVGGTASLPGLDEAFLAILPEAVVTPFTAGTVVGGGAGDPTTILARGCALQALVLSGIADDEAEVRDAFKRGSTHTGTTATTKALGLIFPDAGSTAESLGGRWVVAVPRDTPLPYRRTIQFDQDCGASSGEAQKAGFELWEVKEGVKVEMRAPPQVEDDDDDDEEEEEEPIEVREKIIEKATHLGSLVLPTHHATKEKGRWKARFEVQVVVGSDGAVVVKGWELHNGAKGELNSLSLPPTA